MNELNKLIGNTDVYLIDQILKGSFAEEDIILDAGCGTGRNLIYFLQNDFQLYGIDKNPDAINQLHYQISSIKKDYPLDRFTVGKVEELPYPDQMFDAIISSAVLHFAENEKHFCRMFNELIRVLRPQGMLFARIACDVGMGDDMKPMGGGTYFLPDGSIRFLLTKVLLADIMEKHNLQFAEPFKTVLVDEKRSMSVLVLQKN